ncbi:MAG: kynureninase [Candidatus Limnocylindrales bacterium]
MTAPTDRAAAERLDAQDPLRGLRAAFEIAEPEPIYLDGNSLGRLPKATLERVSGLIRDEWGRHGVRRWSDWIDLPTQVGDKIAAGFLGARPGEVVIGDSTTVNLYRLADAALDARRDRRVILASAGEFPTDRYVLQGLAEARGLDLHLLAHDPIEGLRLADLESALGPETALVCISLVDYRSGALADMAGVTAAVHAAGAIMLWDLSHAVGAVPIDLEAGGVDLAVGCTYKYLSGGPGAPAFLYVRQAHQDRLRQPIQGWFGQADQFAMGHPYDPVSGIGRFEVGTPPIIAMVAVEAAVDLLRRTGVVALRDKSVALTEYLIALWRAWLEPLGFHLGSPADPARRGGHVALRHHDAYRIDRALIEVANVIPDFRPPDVIRLAPVAAYTRFIDVWEAMDRLRGLVESGQHEAFSDERARVT